MPVLSIPSTISVPLILMNRRDFLHSLAGIPISAALADRLFSGSFDMFEGPSSAPALSASMWSYLWDLADEGYDAPLSLLKENGLTSVSLATAYHAGKFLAPHNPKRKVVFLEDGTVYFKPTASLYGMVKPFVNTLVEQGHSLEKLTSECAKKGLETRSWVVCCHNTPLGTAYPNIACETVFGDKLPHNLCPSNDDVRRYLRAIVKDIASKGVTVIELEAMQFQGYVHGFHHEREGVPLPGALRYLLGLCFCPSCRKRQHEAGLDVERLVSFTRETLEAHFADPSKNGQPYAEPAQLPQDLFEPLHAWRRDVVASLAEELAESVQGTGVRLRPLVSIDPLARISVGMDPARVATVTGGILVPGYVKDGDALREPLQRLQQAVGQAEVTVGFQVGLPESGGKSEFLSRMKAARQLGISSFNYYNYGFIPLQNLGWIKEALLP